MIYQPENLKSNYTSILFKDFGLQLDLESFRNKYNSLFWSSIWYFSVLNLPFDLFLPYKKKVISPFKRFVSFQQQSFTLEPFENLEIHHSICLNFKKQQDDESKEMLEDSLEQSYIDTNFMDLFANKTKNSLKTVSLDRGFKLDKQMSLKEGRTKSMDLPREILNNLP
jgi:hypothetical protein